MPAIGYPIQLMLLVAPAPPLFGITNTSVLDWRGRFHALPPEGLRGSP